MNRLQWTRLSAAVVAFALLTPHTPAQLPTLSDVDSGDGAAATGPLPAWDVAIVRPHPAGDGSMSWQMTEDSVRLSNLPLESMICNAWNIKSYQLSGLSGWMTNDRYDLSAKVAGDDVAAYKKLNNQQRRLMLQNLLTERFHLKLHSESKTLPLYNLVVDKGGSKLKPSTAVDPPSEEEARANPDKYKKGFITMGPGRFEATGEPVSSLASQLANVLEKPVNDTTALTGLYDIALHYRRDETNADSTDAPSIFSAVQDQLGLKLVPGKGPVETLIVDSADKPGVD